MNLLKKNLIKQFKQKQTLSPRIIPQPQRNKCNDTEPLDFSSSWNIISGTGSFCNIESPLNKHRKTAYSTTASLQQTFNIYDDGTMCSKSIEFLLEQ